MLLESPLAQEHFGPSCIKIGPRVHELLLESCNYRKLDHVSYQKVTGKNFMITFDKIMPNLLPDGPIWKQQRRFCSELDDKSSCVLCEFLKTF